MTRCGNPCASGTIKHARKKPIASGYGVTSCFIKNVIGRDVGDLGEVIRARKPKRLPVVMTRQEVKSVLDHLNGDKWLMASLLYGSGLRLMECLRLREG